MFLENSKHHLYAFMLDGEFVELPPEKWKEGKCARLIYTLYGMRVAASNWGKEYSKTLEKVGFQPGRATVVAFFHPERDMQETSHTEEHNVFGWVVGLSGWRMSQSRFFAMVLGHDMVSE